ncbi:MAG: PqqD family protein [Clostridiales bacterium]|jgi:hypothetical protein|nr:PqqD family protein [Clostridiales bacterium]
MKVKDGFILRKMSDMGVVAPVGEISENFHGMVTLNQTGIYLWELMQQEITGEQLAESLMEEYDVDQETAAQDVENFLRKAREAGIVQD